MKVKLITYGDIDSKTGGYIYNFEVVRALQQSGMDVQFMDITPQKTTIPPLNDTHIVIIDGLVSEFIYPYLLTWKESNPALKIIYLAHLPVETIPYEKTGDSEERKVIALSDFVICTGIITSENLQFLHPEAPISCIEPGIPVLKRRFRYNNQLNTIVASGSLIQRKGYHTLISTLGNFRTQNWHLEIYGHKDREPSYLYELNKLIFSHDLTYHVTLKGSIGREEMIERLRDCDLFISSSEHETYGMAVQEAVAMGTPCMLTRIPEYSRRLVDSPVVWFDPGNTDQLSVKLGKLILSDKEYISLAKKWKSFRIGEVRNWQHVAEDWMSVLNEVYA